LTYIFGIGRKLSIKILEKAKINKNKIVSKWSNEESNKIRNVINEEYKIEGELKSEIKINIKRLIDIGCYRGKRHKIGLPSRGQKTKNNSRTKKGKKKIITSKKVSKVTKKKK
jgi:small subunit ribosomal protein S13